MRMLIILTLSLLVLSCEKQPLTFEPDTRVSQSVPSGQIGPQIDTLFTSWKEFYNEVYQYQVVQLYKNQMDNGYFGIEPFQSFGAYNWIAPQSRWLDKYESITINFTYITTPSAHCMDFAIEFGRGTHNSCAPLILFDWRPQSADTFDVSFTIPMDTIQAYTINNTYQDVDYVAIAFASNWLNQEVKDPFSVNIYTSYLSELLITGVRRQDSQGKGE